jgi:hypothetical protein
MIKDNRSLLEGQEEGTGTLIDKILDKNYNKN